MKAGFDYAATGANLYTANCSACHGASGAGVRCVFRRWPVTRSSSPAMRRRRSRSCCTGFTVRRSRERGMLAKCTLPAAGDNDIAAIIDHERTSWGNAAPTINPDDVKRAGEAGPLRPDVHKRLPRGRRVLRKQGRPGHHHGCGRRRSVRHRHLLDCRSESGLRFAVGRPDHDPDDDRRQGYCARIGMVTGTGLRVRPRGSGAQGRRPPHPRRRDDVVRRAHRCGQVDDRQARHALLRPDRREVCGSTATTCATSRSNRSAASWAWCRRSRSCSRAPCATTSPSRGPTRPTTK